MTVEKVEVAIIGAGVFGLTAAKTYLEVHPDVSMVVLESMGSVGGVWSQQRLYPGLMSNNILGGAESPDFPMDTATFGVNPEEHIPGQVLNDYWTKFSQKFGIDKKLRLNTEVESVEDHGDEGWLITTSSAGSQSQILARKLIVATGVTADPFMPDIKGSEVFEAPLFHAKYFHQNAGLLKSCQRVAVLGGAKSAWDVAYAFATAGVKVDMIIRESGKGPVWMAPTYVTPLKKVLERLVMTRFLTWLSPCIWGDADGYGTVRRLLHGTYIGRKIVDAFWWILANDTRTLNGFQKHPEVNKLNPWSEAFWIGANLSILNYPTDFFELVRNGSIKVHHADISHLLSKTVVLSSGHSLQIDALICATGWKHAPTVKFNPPELSKGLGLPYYTPGTSSLALKADEEIFKRLPRLANQPNVYPKRKASSGETLEPPDTPNQPYRLYRFIAPPDPRYFHRRNIAFIGYIFSLSPAICSQLQTLWTVAFFDGKLPITSSDEEVKWEAELWSRFAKWRCPAGSGSKLPDVAFDTLPYIDTLIKDLGLEHTRKSSFLKVCTEPYVPEDYRGVVQEWISTQEGGTSRDKKKR